MSQDALTAAERALCAARSASTDDERVEHVRAARSAIEAVRRVLYTLEQRCAGLELGAPCAWSEADNRVSRRERDRERRGDA